MAAREDRDIKLAPEVRIILGQREHVPRRLKSRASISRSVSTAPSRLLGSIWSTVISIPTLSSQATEGTATLSTIHGICQKRVAWSHETLSSRWLCSCRPKLEQYHAWHSCAMDIRNGVFTPAKFRTPIPASKMTTGLASAIALQGVRWRHLLEGQLHLFAHERSILEGFLFCLSISSISFDVHISLLS